MTDEYELPIELKKELLSSIMISQIQNNEIEFDITEFISILHREQPDKSRAELVKTVKKFLTEAGLDIV